MTRTMLQKHDNGRKKLKMQAKFIEVHAWRNFNKVEKDHSPILSIPVLPSTCWNPLKKPFNICLIYMVQKFLTKHGNSLNRMQKHNHASLLETGRDRLTSALMLCALHDLTGRAARGTATAFPRKELGRESTDLLPRAARGALQAQSSSIFQILFCNRDAALSRLVYDLSSAHAWGWLITMCNSVWQKRNCGRAELLTREAGG